MKAASWLKTVLVLVVLFVSTWQVPEGPIDPWHLFNLKKLLTLVSALALIQAMGSLLILLLGPRMGAVFTGLLVLLR